MVLGRDSVCVTTVRRFCKAQIAGPVLQGSALPGSGGEPGAAAEEPSPRGTHLGDLAPAEVGEALEGKRQDVGRPVDGEALAGGHLLLAPEGGVGSARAPGPVLTLVRNSHCAVTTALPARDVWLPTSRHHCGEGQPRQEADQAAQSTSQLEAETQKGLWADAAKNNQSDRLVTAGQAGIPCTKPDTRRGGGGRRRDRQLPSTGQA